MCFAFAAAWDARKERKEGQRKRISRQPASARTTRWVWVWTAGGLERERGRAEARARVCVWVGGTHRVQHLEDVVAGPVWHELEGHERLLVGHPPNGVQNPPNLVRGTAQVAQVGDRLPIGYLGGLRGLDDVARGRLQGQARALLPRPGVAPRAPWGGDVLKRAPPPDGTGRRCPRGRDPARLRHSPRERHGGTDRTETHSSLRFVRWCAPFLTQRSSHPAT